MDVPSISLERFFSVYCSGGIWVKRWKEENRIIKVSIDIIDVRFITILKEHDIKMIEKKQCAAENFSSFLTCVLMISHNFPSLQENRLYCFRR